MKVILGCALFAPVQYFVHLTRANDALIEVCDSYQRRSYRNRYVIYAANGPMALSVPVANESGKKSMTRDVRVAYHLPWPDNHIRSIESAYNSSPYYLYYRDEIDAILQKKWTFLKDLNEAALAFALDCADIDPSVVSYTEDFFGTYDDRRDFRELIHPRMDIAREEEFKPQPYRQVLGLGKEFAPNLSILDLIFNKGPETPLVLRDSYRNTQL